MAVRLILLALVAAALVGLLSYSQRTTGPLKVSGYLEADEIRLGSRVGGRVARVLVEEGQSVKPGQVLVELEPFDLKARQAEAQAGLESARQEQERLAAGENSAEIRQAEARRDQLAAKLALLEAGPRAQEITAARARLKAAQAEQVLTGQNYERTMTLFQRKAASESDRDRAVEQRNAASATVVVREQELAVLKEGTRKEELDAARAQLAEAEQLVALSRRDIPINARQAAASVGAAQAALDLIGRQLAELEIRAPSAGVIEAVELQPGDLVSAGAPVLSMLDEGRLWMRAYVPGDRLNLAPGDTVEVTIDGFPDEPFAAEVTYVSRQAEFTPSNVQTPEERVRQVFRIKVTLKEPPERLRPGMTGDVYLGE